MIDITLRADNPEEVTQWAIRWLRNQGYRVEKEGVWETPQSFCRRNGIWVGSFTRIRARENCPEFDKLEGKTGRLIMMKSTPALEDFVSTHKRNEPEMTVK